ncbi:MAG: NAD(P)/FAD-dependent oxidoreductase, partial [Anaerolineaceae bacterium]
PFFKTLDLKQQGVEWVYPLVSLAHPLDDQPAVLAYRSLDRTAQSIGADGAAYQRLMEPLLLRWDQLNRDIMGPLRIPAYPFTLARFGLPALLSAAGLAENRFKQERARALFAGMAGHSMLPLTRFASAAFGLILSLSAHAVGWPVVAGGSQKIADALLAALTALGGEVSTGWKVASWNELPPARAYLMDVSPRQLLAIAGDELGGLYRRQLARYRYGPGVFKIDWALDGPIPWRDPSVMQAATVHVGGTLAEITHSEQNVWQGKHSKKPYVLLVQSSLIDGSRAPSGRHTAWAYCHVPPGSTRDMRPAIEAQIERFAPGFRDRVLAVHTTNAAQYEAYNPNYIGGDINAGVQDFWQFIARPV